MPAALIFALRARVVSGGSVRGRCTSLKVMDVTPNFSAIASASSSVNSRMEYEATPSVRRAGTGVVAPASVKPPSAVQLAAAAAAPKKLRRVTGSAIDAPPPASYTSNRRIGAPAVTGHESGVARDGR